MSLYVELAFKKELPSNILVKEKICSEKLDLFPDAEGAKNLFDGFLGAVYAVKFRD